MSQTHKQLAPQPYLKLVLETHPTPEEPEGIVVLVGYFADEAAAIRQRAKVLRRNPGWEHHRWVLLGEAGVEKVLT